MKRCFLALAASIGLYAAPAHAATVQVNVANTSGVEDGSAANPYNTIQEGINAAAAYDSVLVAPGTYAEAIVLKNDVLVESAGGPDLTIIDSGGAYYAVSLAGNGAPNCSIRGFTVRNATGSLVYISSTNVWTSSFLFMDQCILENGSLGVGGAWFGNLDMQRTVVRNVGTGISSPNNGGFKVTNSTFDAISGTAMRSAASLTVYNTTISNSNQAFFAPSSAVGGTNVNVWNVAVPNEVSTWSVGNVISVDPMFVAAPTDYRLQVGSPLVDAGTTGTYQPFPFEYLGTAPDIGAYENVGVDQTGPRTTVTSPAAGASLRGTVTVTATVTDKLSGVAGAELWIDGAPTTIPAVLADGVASFSLATTALVNGVSVLEVHSYDGLGNVGVSQQVAVTIDNSAPSVLITSPAPNAWIRGTATFTANVSDNIGVTKADIWFGWMSMQGPQGPSVTPVNGVVTLPFDTRDPAIVAHGEGARVGIEVRGYDAAGNYGYSRWGYYVDNTPPTVEITSPTNGSTVKQTISVAVTASDATSGVTKVDCYVDGVSFGTASATPYACTLDTKPLSRGTHTLTAVATDAAGNTTTSVPVSVVR